MNLKNSLIFIIVALFFVVTVIFLNSSLFMLTAILLFMLGYSYFKWKNKCKAEEEIKAVVASYIKPNAEWPSKIIIPEERLKKLATSLARRKVLLPQATINKMVEETLLKEMEQRFEISFYAHNPDMPKDPSIYQWVQAYVATFDNQTEYIPLLQRLMKKRGVRYPVEKLEEKVEAEYQKLESRRKLPKQLKKKSPA